MRTWARRLVYVTLAVLALSATAGGGAWLYLQSPPGQAQLRQEVIGALEGALHGSAIVGAVSVNGREVELRNLKLYDPERRLLAEVAVLRLEISTADLLRGRLAASSGLAVRPRLYLPARERALTFLRAITSGGARQEGAERSGMLPRRSLLLQHLSIEDGAVAFVGSGESRSLDGISGTISNAWAEPDRSFHAEVDLRTAGASLDTSWDGGADGDLRADVRKASLEPRAAAALGLPSLQVPVRLSGTAELHGDGLRGQVSAWAGRASASLRGTLDMKRRWSDGLVLEIRGVDLSELVANGPPTDLGLTVDGRGGGPTLDALQGTVEITVPPSRVRGEMLGPIRLSAGVDGGRLHVPALAAELPGLSVSASGDGTAEQLSVRGTLRASDLSALSRALGHLGELRLPELEGKGALQLAVEGPVKHPRVTLKGDFPWLRFGEDSMRGVAVKATVADVRRPLDAVAKVEAAQLDVRGRHCRGLSLEIANAGGALTADVRATRILADAGGAWRDGDELAAHLAGDLDAGERGLLVRELSVRSPEATWTLQGPAHVTVDRTAWLTADPLHLRSEAQAVTVSGRASRESVDASLRVQRLDLRLLPPDLVDRSFGLAGLVDAEVNVQGTWDDPVVKATARLSHGRVRRWDELDLDLSGTYAGGRAAGRLGLTSRPVRLSAAFDIPVVALIQRRPEPIEASITIDEQPIDPLFETVGWPEHLSGTVYGSLSVKGTADDPSARMLLTVKSLDAPRYPLIERSRPTLTVTATAAPGQGLRAKVEMMSGATGARGELTVSTPFTLAGLMSQLPDEATLMAAKGSVDARLTDFPLEVLEVAQERHLSGRASLTAKLTGTLRDPAVTAHLAGGIVVEDGGSPARPSPSAASVSRTRGSDLVLTELAARIVGQARERWRALTGGDAHHAKQPEPVVECLPRSDLLAGVPAELPADAGSQPTDHAFVRGAVQYDYRNRRSTVVAFLGSPGGGRARLDGAVDLDLSLPALRRGVDPRAATVDAAVSAEGFDLAVLNGSVPRVRDIRGQLSADVRVTRTSDNFDSNGCVALHGGALAIDEHGSYGAIRLRADAQGRKLKIGRLEAQSGSGFAELTGELALTSGGKLHVSGVARSQTFPIIYRYQTHAALTSRLTFQGDLSSSGLDLDHVQFQEAHVQLPEERLRDLHEIDRPQDIVLVDGPPGARREALAGEGPIPWRYTFTVAAPRNVWLEREDLRLVEIGLSEGFRFEYQGRARTYGQIRVAGSEAQVSFVGREFKLGSDSQITFTGPPGSPEINVTGEYTNDREGVTVTVRAFKDKDKDLALSLSSKPEMSEPEIFTLLATGRRTLKYGSCASMCGADAASALGALLASRFRGYLPVDLLSIESGGADSLKGTQIEAGKYFSRFGLFATIQVQFGADPFRGNTYSLHTEYRVGPDVTLQVALDDRTAGGADLVWSREY